MNQNALKYEWVDVNDLPDEHKKRLNLLCIMANRERIHRENMLIQQKAILGRLPDIGLIDIYKDRL